MADSDKDILITPNVSQTSQPEIKFVFNTISSQEIRESKESKSDLPIRFTWKIFSSPSNACSAMKIAQLGHTLTESRWYVGDCNGTEIDMLEQARSSCWQIYLKTDVSIDTVPI